MKNSKWKRVLPLALIVGFSFYLQACPEEKGPMEKAGEAVDEAAHDAKRSIEDAAD